MADSDGVIRFSTVGKLALAGLATAHVGLLSWTLLQSAANGRALEAMRTELAIRVQKADAEHASYVTRSELSETIKRLDAQLGDHTAALRDYAAAMREERTGRGRR